MKILKNIIPKKTTINLTKKGADMTLQIPTTTELDSYKVVAEVAASNPHWKKLGGGGSEKEIISTILSVMLMARELGIPPIQAISGGINNILGKFEISARIMNMLIRKHGHRLQVVERDDNICVIFGKRKDTGEEMQVTYHIEEARRAGLVKPGGGWTKNPTDMLFARAISRLARSLFPDCIGGCYVEGELQESALGKPLDTISDMPDIEIKPVSEEVLELNFDLPTDMHPNAAKLFIQESASTTEKPVNDLIRWANKNPDKFIDKLRAWEDARAFPVLTPDPTQVLVDA